MAQEGFPGSHSTKRNPLSAPGKGFRFTLSRCYARHPKISSIFDDRAGRANPKNKSTEEGRKREECTEIFLLFWIINSEMRELKIKMLNYFMLNYLCGRLVGSLSLCVVAIVAIVFLLFTSFPPFFVCLLNMFLDREDHHFNSFTPHSSPFFSFIVFMFVLLVIFLDITPCVPCASHFPSQLRAREEVYIYSNAFSECGVWAPSDDCYVLRSITAIIIREAS